MLLSDLARRPSLNALDLDPVARDRDGVPRVRSTYRNYGNECASPLTAGPRGWIAQGRRRYRDPAPAGGPTPLSTHAYGRARMGDDPRASVVDKRDEAHEVPSLVVLGDLPD
jgi:choline dehydrogenase-like flavoprotein